MPAPRCCICGTVRNCGKYLDKIFVNMEIISRLFSNYAIIIYADASNDNTIAKLKQYQQKNPRLTLIINTEALLKYRTHRIAKGRNKCLEIIRTKYPNYEYFIMMDCDDRCSGRVDSNVLAKYLHSITNCDAISFNHPCGYYDCWALSIRPFVLSCHHFKDNEQWTRYIKTLLRLTPKNRLVNCLSAFNGFSLYRTAKFISGTYSGKFDVSYIPRNLIKENIKVSGLPKRGAQTEQDCEHRKFHMQAVFKNNARIRISPHCLFTNCTS